MHKNILPLGLPCISQFVILSVVECYYVCVLIDWIADHPVSASWLRILPPLGMPSHFILSNCCAHDGCSQTSNKNFQFILNELVLLHLSSILVNCFFQALNDYVNHFFFPISAHRASKGTASRFAIVSAVVLGGSGALAYYAFSKTGVKTIPFIFAFSLAFVFPYFDVVAVVLAEDD
jgi:hypothetical protein